MGANVVWLLAFFKPFRFGMTRMSVLCCVVFILKAPIVTYKVSGMYDATNVCSKAVSDHNCGHYKEVHKTDLLKVSQLYWMLCFNNFFSTLCLCGVLCVLYATPKGIRALCDPLYRILTLNPS